MRLLKRDCYNNLFWNFYDFFDTNFGGCIWDCDYSGKISPSRSISKNITVDTIDDHYEISIELPGFKKENIKIEIEDNFLTISAHKSTKDPTSEDIYKQSFKISNIIDMKNITSTHEDGVLKIILNKKKETTNSKIQVKIT